ncbi:MAG: Zn-binding domain-containing protein, partial [Candidatus Hodarchaeales archaeon]
QRDFAGGIHALEHASIALTPLYAMCDRWDIGGTSYPSYPEDEQAKIFIHDSFPGGIGITEQLFSKWESLLENVLQLIKECSCSDGCPSCVQSPKCGNENYPLDKEVAIFILEELYSRRIKHSFAREAEILNNCGKEHEKLLFFLVEKSYYSTKSSLHLCILLT